MPTDADDIAALTVLLVITEITVLWSLWVRRHTWRSRWEASATMCLLNQAIAVPLMSHWGDFIGAWIHKWQGWWNIEDLAAHLLLVASLCLVVHHALSRLADDETGQLYSERAVVYPLTLIVPLACATFTRSNLSKIDRSPFAIDPDLWGQVYWGLLAGLCAWLCGYAIYLFWLLREQRRNRRQANFYIVACSLGLLGAVSRMAGMVFPGWNPHGAVAWLTCDVGAMVFAIVFGRSWLVRQRRLRGRAPVRV